MHYRLRERNGTEHQARFGNSSVSGIRGPGLSLLQFPPVTLASTFHIGTHVCKENVEGDANANVFNPLRRHSTLARKLLSESADCVP